MAERNFQLKRFSISGSRLAERDFQELMDRIEAVANDFLADVDQRERDLARDAIDDELEALGITPGRRDGVAH